MNAAYGVAGLSRFKHSAITITAKILIALWVVYFGICVSQCFAPFGQDSHIHSNFSQVDSHVNGNGDEHQTSEDPSCCDIAQYAAASRNSRGAGLARFVPTLASTPFTAPPIKEVSISWITCSTPVDLCPTIPISPLWPNAPPAVFEFSA